MTEKKKARGLSDKVSDVILVVITAIVSETVPPTAAVRSSSLKALTALHHCT